MDKWTVAQILGDIAAYLELGEANRFKARAYERASREIEKAEGDIVDLVESGGIYETRGVGQSIGKIVEEIVKTGTSRYLDELRAQYPAGIFDLLRVPGLGLGKIGQIYSELGIASVEELERAARAGKLAKLRGFGAKTEEKILRGIEVARSRTSQFLLYKGIEAGEVIRQQLAAIPIIETAEISGSVRRRLEIVRSVDIAIASRDPERALKEIEQRQIVSGFRRVDERTATGVVRNEIEIRFHAAKPEDFGALLLETTGSEEFLVELRTTIAARGFELRGGALFKGKRRVKVATEEEAFTQIGIAPVEPERREDSAELQRKKRPKLIAESDLKGTFHVHTTWSDGRNSVLEMLQAARDRGFFYVGISDHSKSAFYAGGLNEEQLLRQQSEIERHRKDVVPLRVFRGTEADILQDGAIDYGGDTLSSFDFVIASIHSRFRMEKDEMTERIVRAMDNPFVTFIGHLTGRLLLSREGYSVDFDRIFDKAAERGVMIEINGNPNRLDVDWRHVRRALDRGVVLSIHPDAHSIAEMRYVLSGVWVARKAGLTAKDVFNAWPVDEVEEFLRERRKRALGA